MSEGNNNNNKLLRITQMNAIFLDNEIYRALQTIIQSSTKYLPPGFTAHFEHEIALLVRLLLLHNSIWQHDATFGQQLLSIKYERMTPTKKVLYMAAHCLTYVKDKLEFWKPSHDVNKTVTKVHFWILVLGLVNLSVFLRSGTKPQLVERVLGLDQVLACDSGRRHFQSKYLSRELLWNGFIEILVNVLPLINYHKIKRMVKNYNPLRKKATAYVVMNNRSMSMHSKCAHCGETPILPHHMGCAHIFCYVCLKGSQVADSRFECPICEHRNPNVMCERVVVM